MLTHTHTLYLSALIPHDWNVLGEKPQRERTCEPACFHSDKISHWTTKRATNVLMYHSLLCVVLCLTEFMCVSFRHQHTSRPQRHSRAQYHSSHHSERLQRSSTPDQRTYRLWDHLHQRDPSLPRCDTQTMLVFRSISSPVSQVNGELAKKN